MIHIGNEILDVDINERGAELNSIKSKKDGTEYLWQADPEAWGRHAPVLFPIVGKLKNNEYNLNGRNYKMTQHGFARDLIFEVVHKSDDCAEFSLKYNEGTLKKYPFKFQLNIKFQITKNKIVLCYTVSNIDDKEMLFSIGAHPGFRCPLLKGEKLEDYYIEFEKNETLGKSVLKDGLIDDKKEKFVENENIVPLNKELFKNDAVVLENIKSNSISLKSRASGKSIKVEIPGFPYVGIWSTYEGGDFVCIEPWYGVADSVNSSQDFEDKKGIMKLQKGEKFNCSFKIEISNE